MIRRVLSMLAPGAVWVGLAVGLASPGLCIEPPRDSVADIPGGQVTVTHERLPDTAPADRAEVCFAYEGQAGAGFAEYVFMLEGKERFRFFEPGHGPKCVDRSTGFGAVSSQEAAPEDAGGGLGGSSRRAAVPKTVERHVVLFRGPTLDAETRLYEAMIVLPPGYRTLVSWRATR